MADDVIVCEDLSYAYPKQHGFALTDVTLRVRRGEFVGVVGPTGAGKSTLCLALNGIVPHFHGGEFYGSVTVCGLDTADHPTHRLARHVGMIFEDPEMQLTAPSVLAEVAFALENLRFPAPEIRRRVSDALRAVRLDGTEAKHPHQLSGGQKQRLAIASAFALQPEVLVLDEPTSQLDPVGTDEVFELARELNREHGVTIVLVTHVAEAVAEHADRVVLLAAGRVVADGAPDDVLGDVDLLRAHDLRPPDVVELFHRLFPDGCDGGYPTTLEAAVRRYRDLRPPIALHVTPVPAPPPEGAGVAPPVSAPTPVPAEPALAARGLAFAYPDGTAALDGIDLDIGHGEYVAIVGQNGAGKSTLVKHFLHLLDATSGEVRVGGEPVDRYEVSDLARRIGYVSQNPDHQIFTDSVEQEVSFALTALRTPPDEVATRVAEALDELQLGWARERHPLTLSKGDRARVVIAAVLAMRPEVLVFDEPTIGQDHAGARAIMHLTRQLHRAGRTVVLITHHLYLLPGYAERLVVMGRGRVLFDGPLREAYHRPDVLADTFLRPPQLVRFLQAVAPPDGAPLRAVSVDELAPAIPAG